MLVDGKANGTEVELLVDTGATTNLMKADVFYELETTARLFKYKGRLETADGRQVTVIGRARMRLDLGSLDDEVDVLVVHDLQPQMILGLRTLKKHHCSIDLFSNQLWTGTRESTTVPIRLSNPKGVAHYREVTIDSPVCQQPPEGSLKAKANAIVASIGSQVLKEHKEPVNPTEEEESAVVDRIAAMPENELEKVIEKPSNHTQLDDEVEQILRMAATGMPDQERGKLRELVREYRDVFALTNSELGITDIVHHRIETGDSKPIKLPPHRISPAKIPVIQKELQEMLNQGVVQPSNSPYSAPIVLVKKKDGSTRFCVDYRKLNDVTIKDAFRIPKIDQTFDALRGAKFFSSLDLASGYWQVPVAPEHRNKTAFVTPDGGLYEFVRMPFGLSNAPGTFQRLMNELFREHLYKFVLIFLDDVLTYSLTEEEHLEQLKIVFKRLRVANLKLKPKKCRLFQKQVVYLTHIIGNDGVRLDPNKVAAVREWPQPKTVRQVRSFVGFCSYYRRFVKDFAQIAGPLHNLTKKNARFEWSAECQIAFDRLRLELATAPVLQFLKYDSPFIVDTDASNVSLGAVLSNVVDGVEHALVYSSRILSKTEAMYSTTKREALAVVQALKSFNPIYGD